MTRSFRIGLGLALWAVVLFAVSPLASAAVRTFDFDNPYGAYGNPDELCGNKPVPPLFNHPGMGAYTGVWLVGDILPRDDSVGCGHGTLYGDFGSDSYLTAQFGYTNSNLLRFSWDFEGVSAWSKVVTAGNWDEENKRLTQAGLFTDEDPPRTGTHDNVHGGDLITITGGTGVIPGTYLVVGRYNNDTITLATSITGGANVTDASVTATIARDPSAYWANMQTSLFSYTTPLFPNPTVDIRPGSTIEMKIAAAGFDASEVIVASPTLEYSLLIQETNLNLPLGENGGTTGAVELVGADSLMPSARTPVGGLPLVAAPDMYTISYQTVKWTFVDTTDPADGKVEAVDISVDGGTPVRKGIVAGFNSTSDGVLSAATNRGTLASLAIRKPTADNTTKKWFVWIDDVIIDAPGITDPVMVKLPVSDGMTKVTVAFIDPAATAVKLSKGTVGAVVAAGNWTESTLTLTATGAFAAYTYGAGDSIAIGGGTDVTPGTYAVASKVSDDAITLATSITGGADVTDSTVEGTLHKAGVLIATASKPTEGWDTSRTWRFEGLDALVQGEELWASQVVDGLESTDSAHVVVGAFGIIEDFAVYPNPLDDAAGCQARTWHNVSPIAWSYVSAITWEDSNAIRTWDGGWTNGIYAMYPGAIGDTGTFHVEAKVHVYEGSGGANTISRYQMGVKIGPDARCAGAGALGPCAIFGNYIGLTTGDNNALPPQVVSTKEFDAVEGQDLLVAFSTDVQSGSWNGGSIGWSSPPTNNHIKIDNIKLIAGGGAITDCNSVPVANVVGPLLAGATTVDVDSVGTIADAVSVYVNGVKKGTLDTSTTGGGRKTVPLTLGGTYKLRIGDVVHATQTYPETANPSNKIEGCQAAPKGTVGTGANQTPIMLTLGLRETRATAQISQDGGVANSYDGGIEWLGATTVVGGAPQGKLIYPSTAWQTVTFIPPHKPFDPNLDTDLVISYELGNDKNPTQLDAGPVNRGAFEHLAVSIPSGTPNTGPYVLWIDNITQVGVNFGSGFESCVPVTDPPLDYGVGTNQVMFRYPNYLSGFAADFLPSPCESFLDDSQFDPAPGVNPGTKSVKLQFQFSQERRWARLTTYCLYGTPSPYLPNPVVSFSFLHPLTLRILYPPPEMVGGTTCTNPPTVTSVVPSGSPENRTDVPLQIVGTNFVTDLTQVKLRRAATGAEIIAKSVTVTDANNLTAVFDLGALGDSTWDLMVGTCQYATLAGAFGVCDNPTVTSNSPASGATGATISMTVGGTAFKTGATNVKLTRAGQPDIVATTVTVASATSLTATFAFPAFAPPEAIGTWSLVVDTCGGQATRADCFTLNCVTPTVNAPLKAGDTTVTLTGVDPAVQAIAVYADGGPIGTKATGFSGTGTETVTVTALTQGQAINATQSVGGVVSCLPTGVIVGAANSGLYLTLGIRENENLAGPVGSDGTVIVPSGGTDSTYIMSWLVLDKGVAAAPFVAGDSTRATAHNTDWLAADGGEANIRPAAGETTSDGKTWSVFTSTSTTNHEIYLEGAAGNRVYEGDGSAPDLQYCAAYAVVYVRNYGPNISCRARYGSDDGLKAWLNGRSITNGNYDRGYTEDQTTSGSFTLYSGWNSLVVKVSEGVSAWGFGFRLVQNVADVDGAYTLAVPNISVSTDRPLGVANSGGVEWLGATATLSGAGAPQGKLIAPSAEWQTVTFTPGVDPVKNYSYANGVLGGLYGTLDSVAIVPAAANTGPYTLYIDNVTSEGTTFETFEAYGDGVQAMFQNPSYSGSTSANLIPGLDIAAVDAAVGDASAQSEKVSFQFRDTTTDRWLRLVTTNSLNRPNPQVRLDQPITLRVLLVAATPPCNTPPQDADGDLDVDLADFGVFQGCFNGPNRPYTAPTDPKCACMDENKDLDVDLGDFGVFQGCFNGPNRPANSGC